MSNSLKTKLALANSLKTLMKKTELNKISVKNIVDECNLNRQTFYYHFKDIYDLLEWVYTNDATRAIGDKKTYDTWQEGLYEIFKYILDNKSFVLNTYNSLSREYLERYLYNETYLLLIGVVEEKAKGMSVKDKDKSFIADFYKYGFVGLVLEWVRKGMKEEPAEIIERLNMLISGNIEKALESYRRDR